jgi:hypothetical protein
MARQETPRFKFPYPGSTAESWWEVFQDFATGIDTAMLGGLEANAWTFVALPEATIEAAGGGYQLRLLGPCIALSRTYQTQVTIGYASPLALVPGWVVVVRVTSGARAAATTALELRQNGVPIEADYRVLGYVRADSSIAWWNASVLTVGETARLFSHAGGGVATEAIWARGLSSDGGTAHVSMAQEVREHLDDGDLHARRWTATFEAAVPNGEVALGAVVIGVGEGVLYSLVATVTAGASEAVDIELGDAAFTGGPTLLYQIGYAGVEARWNPAVDGPWVDRNPAGIEGLTGGTLYWRVSNAGATPVTVHVALRGLGFEV